MPGVAPAGYLNDPRTKTIVMDRTKAPVVREAFELFATGTYRIMDIAGFLAKHGILSRNGRVWKQHRVSYLILTNPFTTAIFGMVAKSTKEPTSHSSQRNCLIRYKRRGRSEATPGMMSCRSSTTPVFSIVGSAT